MSQLAEITLHLQSVNEILPFPDATLYRKRILSKYVEEFVEEEALAFPHYSAINLTVHLPAGEVFKADDIANAVHQHFAYRKKRSQLKLKRSMQYGWRSLLIALVLLAVIFLLTTIGDRLMPESEVVMFIRESFIILGWVALWRPLDLLIYDRYPIKREINLYRRLEQSNVRVIAKPE